MSNAERIIVFFHSNLRRSSVGVRAGFDKSARAGLRDSALPCQNNARHNTTSIAKVKIYLVEHVLKEFARAVASLPVFVNFALNAKLDLSRSLYHCLRKLTF